MSITYLTSLAMLAISHDMLTDTPKRSLLERDSLTAGLIGRFEDVHKDLTVLTKEGGELQARVQEISELLRESDQVHDRLGRGIYRSLESTADLVSTAQQGRPFIETRDILFPDGLSINTLSYREQSGNVLRVSQRATSTVRAVLARVIADGRTLEECFDEWVVNGELMGKLVAERASLTGEDDATRISAGDLREVRNRWIRTVNVLLSTLDLIEMPEPDRRRLFANLRECANMTGLTRLKASHPSRSRTPAGAAGPEPPAAAQPLSSGSLVRSGAVEPTSCEPTSDEPASGRPPTSADSVRTRATLAQL